MIFIHSSRNNHSDEIPDSIIHNQSTEFTITQGITLLSDEKYINFKNIIEMIIIKLFQKISIFLALKYFCITQIGISRIKATKFHIHKNIQTNKIDSSTNQKKYTIVKWNTIHVNQKNIVTRNKFFLFISRLSSFTQTKFDIFNYILINLYDNSILLIIFQIF